MLELAEIEEGSFPRLVEACAVVADAIEDGGFCEVDVRPVVKEEVIVLELVGAEDDLVAEDPELDISCDELEDDDDCRDALMPKPTRLSALSVYDERDSRIILPILFLSKSKTVYTFFKNTSPSNH